MDDGADVIGVLHSRAARAARRRHRRHRGDDDRRDPAEGARGGRQARLPGGRRQRGAAPSTSSTTATAPGQSTLDGIIRATNVLLAGKRFVVAGYGWFGRGVAMRAQGHGRARDRHRGRSDARARGRDGRLRGDADGAGGARSATSSSPRPATSRVITPRALRADEGRRDPLQHGPLQRRDRDRRPCASLATETREAREFVEEFTLADGRRIYLLAEGRLVNLSAAEGHPAHVMDMSFANQALSAEYVVQNAAKLERKVYVVPKEIDDEIARLKLATMGIAIDSSPRSRRSTSPRGTRARRPAQDLEPERIVRLEDDAVVLLDQRRLPGRGGRARAAATRRRWPRRSGRSPSAARRRSASPPRTATRSRRARARTSTRPTRARGVAADGRQPRWALERDAAATRRAERARALHDDEVERCRAMGAHAADAASRPARAR